MRTMLIYPRSSQVDKGDDEADSDRTASSSDRSSATQCPTSPQERSDGTDIDRIIVRIEIEDTGVGIRSSDLKENRLFSAFVQTEAGKKQGGKGTGLGLRSVG